MLLSTYVGLLWPRWQQGPVIIHLILDRSLYYLLTETLEVMEGKSAYSLKDDSRLASESIKDKY